MHLENGAKLRRYIFLQQLLIGIVQGLLTIPMLSMKINRWIAGTVGILNFILSVVLIGHFGVDLYPSGVDSKQTEAMCVIGSAFLTNFIALCAILKLNQDYDLTSILTFQSAASSLTALAAFFYITVYLTLLMSIGFATYFLIDVSEHSHTVKQEADVEQGKPDAGLVPKLYEPNPRRKDCVLKQECHIGRTEGVERRPKTYRGSSQVSQRSLGFSPSPCRHIHRDSGSVDDIPRFERPRRKSSSLRDRPVSQFPPTKVPPFRPPTPPPPPPDMTKAAERSMKRLEEYQTFQDQIRDRQWTLKPSKGPRYTSRR